MQVRTTQLSRLLRRQMTAAETKLWHKLKNRQLANFKFRRQYPIGGYVADFACIEAKLIVELDGWQHTRVANNFYDRLRTERLEGLRYLVLRFWNIEVADNLGGVCERILEQLHIASGGIAPPHPNPLLPGEGIPSMRVGRPGNAPAVQQRSLSRRERVASLSEPGEGVRSLPIQALNEAARC